MTSDLAGKSIVAQPRRVAMLAYTFYENDGRVMRYAEALAQDGAQVDAIVLGREGQPRIEVIHGVRVIRVQTRQKNERGKLTYLLRLLRFFIRSMAEVSLQHWRAPYQLIHVHSVPDFEVFAALVPKLGGARLVLDIHDIVPEFYAAKFGVGQDTMVFKALKVVEKLSARFADHVIAANDLWLDKIAARAVDRAKCSAFINYPDLGVFSPDLRRRHDDGRFVIVYPGTLNWHQGLDIAVRAFAIAAREAPGMEFHIFGEGPEKQNLQRLIEELSLQDGVFLHLPRPQREIAAVMADADLGVVPKRDDSFGGDAFSTKIMEFMALRVPVVAAATRVDRHYFDGSVIRFFEPGDAQDLARAIVDIRSGTQRGAAQAAQALRFAQANSWGVRKLDYLALVQRLVHAGA
jgi:glycosyltransferase involved in cell wall biosynthesis